MESRRQNRREVPFHSVRNFLHETLGCAGRSLGRGHSWQTPLVAARDLQLGDWVLASLEA